MDMSRVLTVTQINEYVRMLLESHEFLHGVWLRGEISNFKNHYKTGHFYFSVKDETSALRAVMFRGSNQRLTFVPQDGMKVLLHGKIISYPRDGQTQIVVDEMQPDGAGALALAFEQLRKKLEAEGLFAAERKRPLPRFPRRIGIITSPTGAAIHDMIRITGRRYPLAELILYPALVQGGGAPLSLRTGIEFFNSVELVDVIIIGRGGGSVEDLWAFNDEALARTVAASRLPVISAVGHESDVTSCDFVADLRAPTPSGAAEAAVPDSAELRQLLIQKNARLQHRVCAELQRLRGILSAREKHRLLTSPQESFDMRRMHLVMREERLAHLVGQGLAQKRASFVRATARLEGLNPLSVLTRGYAMVTNEIGDTVTGVGQLTAGQGVTLHFADGAADVCVERTRAEKKQKKEEA